MPHVRDAADRDCPAARDRAPARVTLPVLSAVVVISATAIVASLLGLPVSAVLAVTALVAIAGACVAHRTVTNVLAGLVLLLVRPYAPGERLRLELAEPVEAELVRIGFANTTLATEAGLLLVPNRRLLAPDCTKTSKQA